MSCDMSQGRLQVPSCRTTMLMALVSPAESGPDCTRQPWGGIAVRAKGWNGVVPVPCVFQVEVEAIRSIFSAHC